MKLTFLFLVISLLTFTAEASAQRVSISLNNVKVEKILSTITKQTGLSVAYSKQIVNLDRRMSIQVEDADVAQVLEKLVADTNLSYEIRNNKIYLFEKSPTTIPIVAQQKKHITGIVVDQNGDPIIGANVVEKGSSNGTITDIDGNFSLQVSEKSILTVSYIGYETKDVKVGNQSKLQIALSEDTQFIDEVVVVGFGTQKKVNLTGAVSVINSEALEARPVTTATQALQGVLPGLNIGMNNGGGELNNSLEINIRGAGTIGDGSKSSPLVLIDGMDGDINMLNPQDIESVSVLKDAAAASIYGSRASFGVILITTKKGKEGKTNISYNNSFRWSSPMRMPEMMDSYTFANYWNTASTNAHQGVVFDEETMGRIIAFQKGEITTQGVSDPNNPNRYQMYEKGNNNIDWLKEHFKSGAFAQEHNLSVNGGSQKIQFYLSANYLGQEGLLRYGGDDYKRYSFTSKINAQLADWASVNVSTKFLRGDQSQPTYLTENTRLFFNELSRKWPVTPRNYEHGGYTSTSRIIPLEDGGRYKSQNDYLYQQLQLVLEPIKNWKLFGEVNYRVHNKNEHTEILETSELGIDGINSQIEGVAGYAKGLTRITENYYKENFLNTNLYT
ncbi:SusC/RagA family TonB-linked outer membrane protein, partial [Parabacteroides goldsteinii]